MSFEKWVEEMISRIKIVEQQSRLNGISEKEKELLLDRSVEPFGLWKGESIEKTVPPVNSEEVRNAIEAAKKKYKLRDEDGVLRCEGYLEREKFEHCASFLKGYGYSYDKSIKGFKKIIQGVQ